MGITHFTSIPLNSGYNLENPMKKLIPFLLIIALFSIAAEANPHPITYERGRSLDINDYDVESIKYNGPFWDPNLNVRAFNVGGEGRLIRSKIGVNPSFYYPTYFYGHYPVRYDYPYGYQKFYGYSYERRPVFNDCTRTTLNRGYYSNTLYDCGERYYSY